MTIHRGGRSAVAVAIAGLMTTMVAGPSTAGPAKTKSFTATGYPYADYFYSFPTSNDTYTCFDGLDGVHKTIKPFKAPADGVLEAWTQEFEGDWDLALFDRKGDIASFPYQTQWITQSASERVTLRMKRGEKGAIGACNWSSAQTSIEVHYRFRPGDEALQEAQVRDFDSIVPGAKSQLREHVPVNFVFVGYDPSEVDARAFRRVLPQRYRPIVRMPDILYGIRNFLGIEYTYDYDTVFAPAKYEDSLFRYLSSIAQRSTPNQYQRLYNAQTSNLRDVTTNFNISAPKVERWLADNPPAGVDTSEYTIFFIDWFGRKDFRHHVYVKPGEPDVDTGYDWSTFAYEQTIAWGGTTSDDPESGHGETRRVWFHDLSAGPEAWTANYIVDRKDIDGDGRVDDRMPPSWEYAKKGYKKPSALGKDLAKVARYVAINMLFTTSPLYTPAINSPDIPATVNLDLNTYEGVPGSDASDLWVQEKVVLQKFREWLPYYKLSIDEQDRSVTDPQFAACYEMWMQLYYGPNCHLDRPYSVWANFFVHNALRLPETLDDDKADYEASAFNYAFPQGLGYTFGFADDNYLDGTQSFTHTFVDTSITNYLGMTHILTHEFGHHFGASHPHDGFDFEEGAHYGGWYDRFRFAWVGTQNNTIMNYLTTNNEFSQFDHDNMNRWMTSSYLTAVNSIARSVAARGSSPTADRLLQEADGLAGRAEAAFARHEYMGAAMLAKESYSRARAAARAAGVKIKGRWTGTTVVDQGQRRADRVARDHRRYHRFFVDDWSSFLPPEIIGSTHHERPAPLR